MLVLIMAGGEGSRLNLGEKSMVTFAGKPMLSYVIDAFKEAEFNVVVALTNRNPIAMNWCRINGIDYVKTQGKGYIADLIEAVLEIEEKRPLFTSISDIPCVTSSIIQRIWSYYQNSKKEACSTWVPLQLTQNLGISVRYIEFVEGEKVDPVGVNILNGKNIERPQEEYKLVLNEPELAFHVNTRQDLEIVRQHFHIKF